MFTLADDEYRKLFSRMVVAIPKRRRANASWKVSSLCGVRLSVSLLSRLHAHVCSLQQVDCVAGSLHHKFHSRSLYRTPFLYLLVLPAVAARVQSYPTFNNVCLWSRSENTKASPGKKTREERQLLVQTRNAVDFKKTNGGKKRKGIRKTV